MTVHFLTCATTGYTSWSLLAINICAGQPWIDFVSTKLTSVHDYLEMRNPADLYVILDGDVLENGYMSTFASTFEDKWLNYTARRTGPKPVIFSAEPFCWVGRDCTAKDVDRWYTGSAKWDGQNFLNAGLYAGTGKSIVKLLGQALKQTHVKDDQKVFTSLFKNSDIELDYTHTFFKTMIRASRNIFSHLWTPFNYLADLMWRIHSCIDNGKFLYHACQATKVQPFDLNEHECRVGTSMLLHYPGGQKEEGEKTRYLLHICRQPFEQRWLNQILK